MVEHNQAIELKTPANMESALIVRMALSGFGMLAGLDIDLIDDLRTVTDECFDCLMHQAFLLKEVRVFADLREGRLWCRFCAVPTETRIEGALQDYEVTKGILETLLPDVHLDCDENGVCCIVFSMPV